MFRFLGLALFSGALSELEHAQSFDEISHSFEEDAISLMQLRATSAEGQPPQSIQDIIFSYDVPDGWRLGYGMGNRSHPQWSSNRVESLAIRVGQANVRITQKFLDFVKRDREACVAAVQAADDICPDANGVTWGIQIWKTSSRGERYESGYSRKCECDFCWNPIPQDWVINRDVTTSWHPTLSNGAEGWITAGPGTLDPSKYSEKRKAAIIKRQTEMCGNMDGWDPLLGFPPTTTTTTTPTLEDSAEAVGDPHLTTIHGAKFDLDQHHLMPSQ